MRGRIQNRGHRVGTPAVSGSDGRGHAPCGGGGFGGGVPFGRAAFGSARLPRRLEPRQRGLFIVDHGARRRARPVDVKFVWQSHRHRHNGPGRLPTGCAAAHRPCAPSPRYPRPPPRRVSRMPSWTRRGAARRRGFIEDAETSAPRYALEPHRRHLAAPPTRVKNHSPDRRHLPAPTSQAYRVMHGVAEGIPGVTVDKYGSTLFVQSWRSPVVRARLLYPYGTLVPSSAPPIP